MTQIPVSPVKNRNLSSPNPSAQSCGPAAVMLLGRVDHRKARQLTVHFKTQVQLGSSFAPSVLGPIHAREHQLNHAGVDRMNGALETPGSGAAGWSKATPAAKADLALAKLLKHVPKQPLSQLRTAVLTGIGEIIATGRRGTANARQFAGLQFQSITDIVQTETAGHLYKEQRHYVTPQTVAAGLGLHPQLSTQAFD